jgi:hypothetical protein
VVVIIRTIIVFISIFTFIFISGCTKDSNGNQTDNGIPAPLFIEHTIDADFNGIHCIKVIDLDGDGDPDIVGGSEITPYSLSLGVCWWKNNGGNPPSWTRYPVDQDFEHVMSVDVYDLDGDSCLDIIATSWSMHQITWWKNPGNPQSGWERHPIKSGFINAHDAKGFDLNSNGATDIAAVSSGGEVMVIYNDGSLLPAWDFDILDQSFAGGKTILIQDIDLDGDVDLLGIASDANRITLWENRGGMTINWIAHPVDHNFTGGSGLDIIDINGDGLLDIIATSWQANELSYWICLDLSADQWEKHVITTQLGTAVNARGCDMDMDGDIDIVAVGKNPGRLTLYINENLSWTEQVLTTNFEGGSALHVIDLDGDGDPDIVAGASALGRLAWWENRGSG